MINVMRLKIIIINNIVYTIYIIFDFCNNSILKMMSILISIDNFVINKEVCLKSVFESYNFNTTKQNEKNIISKKINRTAPDNIMLYCL